MIDHHTFDAPRALFHTFGCKLNFAETSTVARTLAEAGIFAVEPGETPDLVVVNTCSVTGEADKKCRQALRSYHRRYPNAALVVTGCYAQLKPDEVADIDGVAIVAGNDRKGALTDYIHRFLADRHTRTEVTPAKDIKGFTPSCARGERTRYFLKVQDGCDCWCSYCTIPAARGRSRSATIEQLTAQARQAAAEGAGELVITGVNIGDFGRRTATPSGELLNIGETLPQLIRALDGVEGIARYRISSLEPDLLTDQVLEAWAGSRAFMPHFHIPLQSGSDEVLRLMRRRYDTALFRQRIERIRSLMPDAFIGVDVIAGARGETDEEFLRSLEFIDSLPITRLHVFPYSERPGTLALQIPHVVSQADKHKRVSRLMELSSRKMEQFAGRYLGTVRPVLLEHSRGKRMSGFTDNYLRVNLQAPAGMDNTIAPVRLDSLTSTSTGDIQMEGTLITS